jgi:hypothetical protein
MNIFHNNNLFWAGMFGGAGDPDDSIVLAHVVVDPRGIVIPNGESNEVGRG